VVGTESKYPMRREFAAGILKNVEFVSNEEFIICYLKLGSLYILEATSPNYRAIKIFK
jgi:hypothetical protein